MDKTIVLDESDQAQELSLVDRLKKRAESLCPVFAEYQYHYQQGVDQQNLHDARLLREAAAEIEAWLDQQPKIIGILSSGDTTPIRDNHPIVEFRGKGTMGFVVNKEDVSGVKLGTKYYLVPIDEED
jgi:hypothetical protein